VPKGKAEFGMRELAEASGISARTIRFYIGRGLVTPPGSVGRTATYTQTHLKRLEQIQRLKSKGHTLAEIGRALEGKKGSAKVPPPTSWWSHQVQEDVVVMVRSDIHPWRQKRIHRAIADMAEQLLDEGDNDDNKQ
jgi:DNA-binding transcriptional MerR regulator